MPDWRKIVREKLSSLPLTNGRHNEVIEELAQQLESAYEEALSAGIPEPEARRRSLAQFPDWEKLRGELFHSVEGTRLPVWEQNGIFSPRRLPVWMALTLALLFFFSPAFRQGLAILPVPGTDPTASGSRLSEKVLRRLELSGDKQAYARALAYVALHSPKEEHPRAVNAAEKAIALDPQLTWISAEVSHATYLIPGYDPHPWIERLKAWDPDNAFPYLLEASANIHHWEPPWSKYHASTTGLRDALAAEPLWRGPLERAFAAPRVDFYTAQQFALDRQVLQEHGLDRPDILLADSWSQPLLDFTAINLFAEIRLNVVGENAEKAGRPEDALAAFRSILHFGEKLYGASSYPSQEMLAIRLQQAACERMLPLLRRQERTAESAAIESMLAALAQTDPGRKYLLAQYRAKRSARLFLLAGFFVILFALFTAAWVLFLLVLKWQPNLGRGANRVASALCVAPSLLLLACSALFVSYYPYALPIAQYGSNLDLRQTFGSFLYSSLNVQPPDLDPVWLARMFWPSIWGAVIALAAAFLVWLFARRGRPDQTGAA